MNLLSLRVSVAVILAGIGLIGFVIGLEYDFGSARRMGPGYFPVVLSGLLFVLAVIDGVSAALQPSAQGADPLDWLALCAVLTGVAGFALAIAFFGLIPAFVVVIALTTLSERGYGWKPALILAGVTCIGAWLLFSHLLGMSLPLVQWKL